MQKLKVSRIYIRYQEWEDYHAGMWRTKVENEEELLQLSIEFTGDWKKYGKAMKKVIRAWPNTMLNSLTNPSTNQRAFLGHCAVTWQLGIPEYITRMAWKELTDQQRIDADAIAQKTIDEWKEKYLSILIHGRNDAITKGYQMKLL